jgi:hypothetical protein
LCAEHIPASWNTEEGEGTGVVTGSLVAGRPPGHPRRGAKAKESDPGEPGLFVASYEASGHREGWHWDESKIHTGA